MIDKGRNNGSISNISSNDDLQLLYRVLVITVIMVRGPTKY